MLVVGSDMYIFLVFRVYNTNVKAVLNVAQVCSKHPSIYKITHDVSLPLCACVYVCVRVCASAQFPCLLHFDKCTCAVTQVHWNLLFQVVVKGMVERGNGGAIVNVSSQASLLALDGHTVYCSSKAAVDGITRNMALELGKHQVCFPTFWLDVRQNCTCSFGYVAPR